MLIDGVVHALGVSASIVAVAVLFGLVISTQDLLPIVAAMIYGVGMVSMFGFSAAYNLVRAGRWKEALRRCDHSAIYLMIAGTYTPFALIGLGGALGLGLLAVVWTVGSVGVALKLVWPQRFARLSLILYLALGWAGIAAAGSIVAALPLSATILLGVGGLLYTSGVVFHLWTSLYLQNAIWHAFVLMAACCHYFAVVDVVLA